jgi:hypothetical protein
MKRLLWFGLLVVGLVAGCSSGPGSASVPAPINITLGPSGTQNAVAGQAVNVTATVANDSKTAGVTWTLAGSGALSAQTTTSVTYTAPSPVSANATVTITATSVSDSSKTATLMINLQAISVSVSPSSAAPTFGATAAFTATVSNDPGNKGVTWIVTCSAAPCGSVSPMSTASGTAATYTAPSAPPPSTLTVTITATSVADTTKMNSATITVPAILVAVAPPSANIPVNGTAGFTATVTNDTANKGVTWTLTQGGAICSPACGTITAATASGTPATYTAPAGVPPTPTVTLTATSAADGTKFASATITIIPPPPISVSISPSNPTVTVSSTKQFTATVTNDPAATGVTWTLTQSGVTCVAALCGSVSPTSGTGNTPMTTYTAPATVPTPATVTITATSAADKTKSASTTITIAPASACGSGSESLLTGHYAFLLKGFDSAGNPALVGGVITVDGAGHITAGELDTNLNSGFDSASGGNPLTVSGSYSVGSDDRGCMAITTSAGTQNYRFSLANISSGATPVASTGHMIDFDTAGPFTSGVLRKQSGSFANAILKGNYAFGGSSIQNAAAAVGGGKFTVVGRISFNGLGGVTGGSEDFNQNGTLDGSAANTTWPANPISIDNNGNYSISNNGRGTLSITFSGGHGSSHSVLYVVSSSEALFLTSDSQTTNTIIGGEALKQSTGGFSGTSLSGSYVGYTSALGSTAGTGTTAVNLLLVDVSNPNITGTSSQNDGGAFSSQPIAAGSTYTVDPATGRMVVTGGGGHPPVLYIVNSTRAFLLGSNGRVESGFVESQTGTSLSGAFAFGTLDPQDKNTSDNSGVATFTSPNVNVTEDDNSNGSLTPGGIQNLTYSIDSTSLGGIPSGCTLSATSTTCQTIFYVISPTKAVVMDVGTTTPKVQIADQ